ncbi:hypothetical protein [Wenyingzhuangia aestuarii]|uniref:hypothetical protein n=1 Tax=Wenyingzhuangia aestuarii TaxID=1647582 RepID=UPI0014399B70|nr:hypothetical protein [Wenyingzhuangia aestuarii]NJB83397.1 hypothetical protein [Wenyingzhuangia aestuarii]
MDLKNNHTDSNHKLNSHISFDKVRKQKHEEELGYTLPEGYFSASKNEILRQTVSKNKKTRIIKLISLSAVAAVCAFFFSTVKFTNDVSTEVVINDEESQILISALFVNDKKLEILSDAYMLEELYEEQDVVN